MRKHVWLALIMVVWSGVMSIGLVAAQEKITLKLGEYVKGSITEKVYEVSYSFSGKKGDVVTLEIVSDPEKPDLDPNIELRDSDGKRLAFNDDFTYPLALAIAELPADGDYIAVAGRANGKDGDSVGDFLIRVTIVELVGPGSTIEAIIDSGYSVPPQIYVMRPEKDAPLEINFSQKVSEYFADIRVLKWLPEAYPDAIVNLDNTVKLSKASLTIDLEAGNFYVIRLAQSFFSFADQLDFPVTIELK